MFQKKVTTSGDYSGSDEEEHDAYLEQMKAEGAERNEDDSDSEGVGKYLTITKFRKTPFVAVYKNSFLSFKDDSDASFNPGDEDEKDVREEYVSECISVCKFTFVVVTLARNRHCIVYNFLRKKS